MSYETEQAELAIVLHNLQLRAAAEKDWATYSALSAHIADRSPVMLTMLAEAILKQDKEEETYRGDREVQNLQG